MRWLGTRLHRAPEGLKRRLRPLLVRAGVALKHVPGSGPALGLMRRATPRLYRWLARRHAYYVDAGLGSSPLLGAGLAGEADMDHDTRLVLGWLARDGAGRRA